MFQELNATLGGILSYSSRTWPDRVALREGDREVTYLDLESRVNEVVQGLRAAGVRRGDHVAYLLSVSQHWVEVVFALARVGAVAVPLNLTWTARELNEGLALTDSTFLIVGPDHRDTSLVDLADEARSLPIDRGEGGLGLSRVHTVLAPHDVGSRPWIGRIGQFETSRDVDKDATTPVSPDELAMLLLSSGSTAFPKAVMHTHRSAIAGVVSYSDGLEISPTDVFVHTTPSYHVGGLITAIGPLMRGGSVRLLDWFDPERTMRFIEHDRATLIWGFETHYNNMRNHKAWGSFDLSSISRTMVAANPVAAAVVHGMGFEHIGSLYGSTEYMGSQSYFPYRDRRDVERMLTTNGRPLTGEIRIIDPDQGHCVEPGELGEICVRGPALFAGYYGLPDATAQAMDDDGFFHSGDVGFLDQDGYLSFRGRYKEMVKSGGENVSASEVEQFLVGEIDEVERAVVIGVPDRRWGEAVVAVVETNQPAVSADAIRDACRGKLAGYKIPKEIVFVNADDWIVTATGKLDRRHVQTLAQSVLDQR